MKKKKSVRAKKRPLAIPTCKHFTGYKPCFPATKCLDACVSHDAIGVRILIVNLDAMGNILVTTSLLPALKRKYPASHISWITLKSTVPLLQHNPLIDEVFAWEPENWLILSRMKFDLLLNVDKSRRSGAFVNGITAAEKLGFGMNDDGKIIPLNAEAEENYRLGLDDHTKFRLNQKSVQQLQCEQFRLPYRRDEYSYVLTEEEQEFCREYRARHGLTADQTVLGFNTGCSELYPNKKMTIDQHVSLIERLSTVPGLRLVLVGGPEDTARNAEIVKRVGEKVLSTPTTEGLRRGLCYENICDIVISGDSFGMHAAIALKKYVLVWFGVSCPAEIDLYGRGEKFIPQGLECSPCWKRSCPYGLECIAKIDLDAIAHAALEYKRRRDAGKP